MPFKECVENSWAIKRFASAGNSRVLNGKFKVQVSKQIHKNMASHFKIRLSKLAKFPW